MWSCKCKKNFLPLFVGWIIHRLRFRSRKTNKNIYDEFSRSFPSLCELRYSVGRAYKLDSQYTGTDAVCPKLAEELERIGLTEVTLDDNGYLMASLPSNIDKDVPVVGFIAHLDTSPDMSGRHVSPRIVKNYDGKDIVLCAEEDIVLKPSEFPELHHYIGQDLIVTNGKTLLGADDKAGIAEIVTAMEYLLKHPEIKHGKIRIAFNPDEEIGKGAHKFDVKAFGADWAYTMDGGEIGELEYENFNAAVARVTFKGRNVHPGYAKHK